MRRSVQGPKTPTAGDETPEVDETAVVVDDTDDAEPTAEAVEAVDAVEAVEAQDDAAPTRRVNWSRVLAYGMLPAIALILALTAGALKYVDNSARDDQRAGLEAMAAAKATTAAMLSYTPDDVDKKLRDVRSQLTGDFRTQYSQTTDDVVIPGALSQQVTAETKVPAASVVTVEPHRVVVLLYLDQTITVAAEAPSVTSSSARVTLDEVGGTWLISQFATI
jgi:Mce-associated membrane protein